MAHSSGYGDGNRAFLQALLAHGTLTYEEAKPIIAAIINADNAGDEESEECRPDQVQEETFLEYIDRASAAVSMFDYEIRSTQHQVTKERIFALVNTTSDPQTQLATIFSPEELSFIKRVLDAMFEKFNRPRMESLCITEMQAIKLARPPRRESQGDGDDQSQAPTDRGLKHSEVETVLESLVEGGWFEISKEGFYSLTPRALLELRPWLIDMYNDPDAEPNEWQRIKFCEACKEIVTWGLRCSDPDCTLRLHDICQEAFWRSRRGTACPKCSREWTGDHYVGERAITMTEAYQRGKRRSGGHRSTLADEIVHEQGGDEESEGEEEDE
ncbi:nse1 non-smc component of smc5-6 complex [Trichoderma arundinaceum]|uniref:Non-structural maintenance of chromosomes element 1 homolog n=1 Tax=Trichoderma arundinaceum TaxID=490622 RepID=A0A395NE06_TRIAR|nr:nse1 non-smc component of smc5-6 complex [Trichoderma arundinaceum]